MPLIKFYPKHGKPIAFACEGNTIMPERRFNKRNRSLLQELRKAGKGGQQRHIACQLWTWSQLGFVSNFKPLETSWTMVHTLADERCLVVKTSNAVGIIAAFTYKK